MANPYLGEIRIFSFNFAPKNWALCDGQLLAIAQNAALFSLLGTTYGGNGVTNFALPNLQSRVPIHFGQGLGLSAYNLGDQGGVEQVTLTGATATPHNHPFMATTASADAANRMDPTNSVLGSTATSGDQIFITYNTPLPLNAAVIGNTGGNLPHTNIQPFLVLNVCIALQGIFPPR